MHIGHPSWQSDASNVGLFCYMPHLSGKCSVETGSLKAEQKVSILVKYLGWRYRSISILIDHEDHGLQEGSGLGGRRCHRFLSLVMARYRQVPGRLH